MKITPTLFDYNSIFLLDLLFRKELNLSTFTLERRQLNKCEKRLKNSNFITGSRIGCSGGRMGSLEITDSGRTYLEECKKLPYEVINIPPYDILGILKNSFKKIRSLDEELNSVKPYEQLAYGLLYGINYHSVKYYTYMGLLTDESSLTPKGFAIVQRDILNIIKSKYEYRPELYYYTEFYKYCASFLPEENIAILISSGNHSYLELFNHK